jgi:hypothetical protein
MPPSASFQQDVALWLPTLGSGLVLVVLIREASHLMIVLVREASRCIGDRRWWSRAVERLPNLPPGTEIDFRSGSRRLRIVVGARPTHRDSNVILLEQASRAAGDRRRRH